MLLVDIIISAVLAGILAPLLTYLLYYSKKFKTSKYINKFWNFPRKKHVLIVFPKSEKRPDHDTRIAAERSLNIYGAMAVALINNLLGQLGIKTRLLASDAGLSDQEKESNIVLIGGTLGNDVSMGICEQIKRKLNVYWFGKPGSADDHFLSTLDRSVVFTTELADEEEALKFDHGLVLKFKNPSNPKNTIIVLAGNYGAGTLAATRAALDNDVLFKVHKNVDLRNNIGFVVKCFPKHFDVREYELVGMYFDIK